MFHRKFGSGSRVIQHISYIHNSENLVLAVHSTSVFSQYTHSNLQKYCCKNSCADHECNIKLANGDKLNKLSEPFNEVCLPVEVFQICHPALVTQFSEKKLTFQFKTSKKKIKNTRFESEKNLLKVRSRRNLKIKIQCEGLLISTGSNTGRLLIIIYIHSLPVLVLQWEQMISN